MAGSSNNLLLASVTAPVTGSHTSTRSPGGWQRLPGHPLFWHAATFAVVLCSLFLDLMLPRGATAAIGYAIVPVLAASHRKARFVLAMTALCTALTWTGYLLEPAGIGWWFSLFDRAMVSMVLWLSYLLVHAPAGADGGTR